MRREGVICGLVAVLAIGVGAVSVAPMTAFAQAPLALEGSAAPAPWARYRNWNQTSWDGYNALNRRDRTPPAGREVVVRTVTGDAARGRALAFDRTRGGGCMVCHVMGPGTPPSPGNVGVDLTEIGTAGRTDQWLYNYIFDPRVYNPESVMPPWGKHSFFDDREIRDMVAFLKTLKTPMR